MLPRFFTPDHIELLELLNAYDVDFLLVGGIAVNYYGYARSTGDVDLFYRTERSNVESLYDALSEFFGNGVPTYRNYVPRRAAASAELDDRIDDRIGQ
ncbi:MAG: hypothetical protein ACLFVJ_23195 [Persicimonas sp.]